MQEFYIYNLQHKDRYNYNKFQRYYTVGNKRDKKRYLLSCTVEAQNEKYTYREVLKLISI
ncbi:hypothetical protein EO157G_2320 [Escherichia phage SP27]|uniref:Uncharacterized protein n=1 Tax=Escherichia phage SP27 TaxID=2495557 RepID=A0A5A4U7R7_9CAUD|nr:hypothetical protein EO157G_2320 [Escherichia phage SP27]VVY13788.1 Uncharacterised protein [Escherichia coli]